MKMKNQKGVIDLMLIAAIAFVVLVGGFVLYRISSMTDDPVATKTSETSSEPLCDGCNPKDVPLETSTDDENEFDVEFTLKSDGGNKYSIPELGMEFTAPANWSVVENPEGWNDGLSIQSEGYAILDQPGLTKLESGADISISLYNKMTKDRYLGANADEVKSDDPYVWYPVYLKDSDYNWSTPKVVTLAGGAKAVRTTCGHYEESDCITIFADSYKIDISYLSRVPEYDPLFETFLDSIEIN